MYDNFLLIKDYTSKQISKMPSDKKKLISDELNIMSPEECEKKYVHDIYKSIANHFSATRYKPWPKVEEFLLSLSPDSVMIDVGCGNGKNLGISSGISIGCDMCPELLKIAQNKGHRVIQCDALELQFESNYADAVISIAVIHHFVTLERRKKAIQEMIRITKLGGKILIYVWANSIDNKNNNDYFVGWSKDSNAQDLQRYYHFFDEGELDKLCGSCEGCVIEKSYFDKENYAIILKKI
jgi:ubiquinone/menaquinone biosynthesis C-methylase UbiE